ncbi:hypothetical protein BJ508DRAFT_359251 [Ascobolus immersus RN42]|uniref:Uncharacterized protein n=1 Tax=Ascobolus immersus RN42 TaxID=1160509 RepID=A0A3N4IH59_ASCIM|nr:hypothetical protein BJ508DRAFT_359251 [Ascobolus immersus RN42]
MKRARTTGPFQGKKSDIEHFYALLEGTKNKDDQDYIKSRIRVLKKALKSEDKIISPEILTVPLTPTELRIRLLKAMPTSHYDEKDLMNYHAVLEAYENGTLRVEDKKAYEWAIFWGGHKVLDWGVLRDEFKEGIEHLWPMKFPGGRVWFEDGSICGYEQYAHSWTIDPDANDNFYKLVVTFADALQPNLLHVDREMIIDTVANVGNLFQDDMVALNVTPQYNGWGNDIYIATANGQVLHRLCALQISYHAPAGHLIVFPFLCPFAVNEHKNSTDFGSKRLIGSSLAENLYVGSSPRGNHQLAIATHKGGLMRQLPV